MKHVVYILGAGFSAPLGIPTMKAFLGKASDLSEGDPESAKILASMLATISRLHKSATFYSTDVFNIEEVMSLLEMEGRLHSKPQLAEFRQFIAHVIEKSTPSLVAAVEPARWSELLFCDRPWEEYCSFVAHLLGYNFERSPLPYGQTPTRSAYSLTRRTSREARYSVITLNYDLVLETAAAHLRVACGGVAGFNVSESDESVPLVKLHGSIDTDTLVPPTWQKTLDNVSVQAAWVAAYDALRTANEIRIVGYSLPESDAYVRYLLRAAVIETPNLKRIDVLCLDPQGDVEQRFSQFIRFSGYHFINSNTSAYFAGLMGRYQQWPDAVDANAIEQGHRWVFNR